MTCFNTELKRIMQSRKRAEAEARRLMKTEDEPGEFEYVLPAETIRARVRQATLRQQLNSDMSSKQVLEFLRRAWTPEELRTILLKARTTEPVLERIANRNRAVLRRFCNHDPRTGDRTRGKRRHALSRASKYIGDVSSARQTLLEARGARGIGQWPALGVCLALRETTLGVRLVKLVPGDAGRQV